MRILTLEKWAKNSKDQTVQFFYCEHCMAWVTGKILNDIYGQNLNCKCCGVDLVEDYKPNPPPPLSTLKTIKQINT